MINGLFSADLARVIETIQSLVSIMAPKQQPSSGEDNQKMDDVSSDITPYTVKDTRMELAKCYDLVMNNAQRLYINPANNSYLEHFRCHDPVCVF